ncbi:guanine nucleotide-binding protein-like 3 homolog [Babylonia areolata]|uniref:guanine nucleotide-binding protein-like 3 homolog n=1 Tax=Babylonia areolata TaxID=304850 RepID=UPI003FD18BC9
MVGLKKNSKRMTTKRRVKIERKVKEHNRKKRKEARKNPKKGKKKDPGVPSSLPFKEIVLKEFEEKKRQAEEERAKKREMLKKKRQKSRENLQNKNRNFTDLVADAEKRQAEYDRKQAKDKTDDLKSHQSSSVETSRQTFVKEFRKVVQAADVVLEVLDARDPLGTRCQELESIVLASATNKKLVLILNKIDLIPKENAEEWVKYLRNEFPTVAFKASTQTQNDHLSQRKVQLNNLTESLSRSSHCLGADVLMKLLANYCRNQDIKTSIRVGIVGFPNTGKSSIINSLKRSKACTVGAMPGITKAMQEVSLDKNIKLLDSPGVVMETGQSPVTAVLRNVVKLESIEDPFGPVEHILSRCGKEQLMLHYNLPDFSNVDEFLSALAKRQGRLKKGGIPDCGKAARAVLQDWTSGRITYYTRPPEDQSTISATICSELKEAFDINTATLSGLPSKSGRSPLVVDSLGPVAGIVDPDSLPAEDMEEEEEEDDENEDDMEEEEDADDRKGATMNPIVTLKQKSKGAESPEEKVTVLQANKARKKAFKQMKKNRKRSDALAGKLSSALETAFNIGLGDDDNDDDDEDMT